MVSISIKADIREATKYLAFVEKKQINFAAKNTLNRLAYQGMQGEKKAAKVQINEPIGFTLRGFRYRSATTKRLRSAVYIEPLQWKYLKYIIEGGTRIPPKNRTAVPRQIKLNKYGNIPGRHGGLIKKQTQFIATINGLYGLWERPPKTKRRGKNKADHDKIWLLARIMNRVEYEKSFKFYETVQTIVHQRFRRIFDKEISKALKSAR